MIRRLLAFCGLGLLAFSSPVFAVTLPPAPSARVNDYAGLLSPVSGQELEEKLKAFEKETSNQVVVVTFPSLEGENLEEFSLRLSEAWKLGKKGRDNGVLLLIIAKDKALRIETGYGLEGALPDAVSKSILETRIIPQFRKGDFSAGIFAGVDAIVAATKGEYRVDSDGSGAALLFLLFVLLLFGIIFWIQIRKGRGGYTLGSGWGRSGRWDWPSGSGGSWGSSGSSWGGGGGGGGFSGGGGSFGGGGASGRW